MPVTKITTSTTTNIKQAPGYLNSIIVSAPGTSWTLQVNDTGNQSFTGPTIMGGTPITVPAAGTNLIPTPVPFSNGLQVVTAGATPGEIEVSWN